jgi:PTH1 family peptidyl-tRNA hydrolase
VDLIAGLGNPGPRYKNTRHNIGFQVIDLFSKQLGVRLTGRRFQSRNARLKYREKDIILLCPTTFMNLSGKSIKACAAYYHLKAQKILIIHDDIDLPIGRIKVVKHGSAGGHKGVQSVIDYFGNNYFPRVKIGIGRPRHGETIEDYVLSPFYEDQKDIKEGVIKLAVLACQLFVSDGVESAMNQINSQKTESKEVRN